jgi:hypothetical protein
VGHAGIIFTPRLIADAYDTLSCALRPAMSRARVESPVRTLGDLADPCPIFGAPGALATSPFAERDERAESLVCEALALGLLPHPTRAAAVANISEQPYLVFISNLVEQVA